MSKRPFGLSLDQAENFDRLSDNYPLTPDQISTQVSGKDPRIEGPRATGDVAAHLILDRINDNIARQAAERERLEARRSEESDREIIDLFRS